MHQVVSQRQTLQVFDQGTPRDSWRGAVWRGTRVDYELKIGNDWQLFGASPSIANKFLEGKTVSFPLNVIVYAGRREPSIVLVTCIVLYDALRDAT